MNLLRPTLKLALLLGCTTMLACGTAAASTVSVNISGSADGFESPQVAELAIDVVDGRFASQLSDTDSSLQAAPGSESSPIWDITEFSIEGATNPEVTLSFTIVNTSDSVADLELAAFVPLSEVFGPENVAFGSLDLSLVDFGGNGDPADGSAAATPLGSSPIYTSIVGGTSAGVDVTGGDVVFTFVPPGPPILPPAGVSVDSLGGLGTLSVSDTDLIGPVSGSIAIEYNSTLTPGDALSVTAVFRVTPVPEPASVALVGLAGLALVARRR